MPACYLFDIDGTLFEFGTNRWLPGASATLKALMKNGHQIILTTQRTNDIGIPEAFAEKKIPYPQILINVLNPRVVVNDFGAFAHDHTSNTPWTEAEANKLLEQVNGR